MQIYIGFGFNVTDIGDCDVWLRLLQGADPDIADELRRECGNDAARHALEVIEEVACSPADYLAGIINAGERDMTGPGSDAVVAYDDYIVFDSVRFADDSPRTRYIRTQEDFVGIISKYIPIDHLRFDNVYCECPDWIAPQYSF